ncbi:MAG: manganese efflux pump [Ruminococcaceae bacterium]|nr:manganese efflux pump [Oscillospiraceae bacterium]
MNFPELILLGAGLAMDAFAVAVCKGLCMKKINYGYSLIIALFFGVFQALMPYLGYLLGNTFAGFIGEVDHFITFALLSYIGGKMMYESGHSNDEGLVCPVNFKPDYRELFVLSVATSIDAFAVGVTFSFEKSINIFKNISVIGITTFIIAFAGVIIGNTFGAKYKNKAEFAGGLVLVILGIKILIEGIL